MSIRKSVNGYEFTNFLEIIRVGHLAPPAPNGDFWMEGLFRRMDMVGVATAGL